MNQETTKRKKTGRWVIALIVVLMLLAGGGWWLWGKDRLRGAGTEEVKKEAQPGKEVAAMPAPGGDEERLAEAEKGERVVEEPTLAQEKDKKPAKMIEYKKRVIKDFGAWNSGDYSLQKTESYCPYSGYDCPPPLGPRGLLVNKEKEIYIFNLYNITIYNSNGIVVKRFSDSDRPMGVDSFGNIYCYNTIYDRDLNTLRSSFMNSNFIWFHYHYISDDRKIYFLAEDALKYAELNDQTLYYYVCDPFSKELRVDEGIAKYNPNKPPSMVMPCDNLDEADAPLYLVSVSNWKKKQYPVDIRGILNSSLNDNTFYIQVSKLFALDEENNSYWFYRKSNRSEGNISKRGIAIFNKEGEFVSKMELCEDKVELVDPSDPDRYIYVERFSGFVYQICTDEQGASLIVWEK